MYNLVPFQWNAVIVGHWNPHILTPKGIANIIFGKTGEEPLEIQVPLNAIAPFKVHIEDLITFADFERLVIECEKCQWECLDKARKACCKAIDALPITPMTACGYNVRYHFKDPTERFIDLLSVPLDTAISDSSFRIHGREIRRSILWEGGLINIHIEKLNTGAYNLLFNFDKTSSSTSELKNWMMLPIEKIKELSLKLISLMELAAEEKK